MKRLLARGLIGGLTGFIAAYDAMAEQTRAPAPSFKSRIEVETVARGLNHPWGMQFLPDGRMVVTERPGRLRIVDAKGVLSPPVAGVPPVFATGQGGLLDVALDPQFASTGRIYISFAEPRGAGTAGTSVASARLTLAGQGGALSDVRVIFRQEPATSGGLHFGSRIAIARDGHLFVTTGERFQRGRSQDLSAHYGKVIRIAPDGSVPNDNPKWPNADARPQIWSLGHRNIQAAAIEPASGRLWTVEHGARGGDELNRPEAGKNYGWPIITYGIDYSGAKIGVGTKREGLEQPIYYWDPSIAPSGMAFYAHDRFPQWRGNIFVGALAGQHIARLVMRGDEVVGEERLLGDLGERIRDVRQGPDGAIYALTDHPEGRILRVSLRP